MVMRLLVLVLGACSAANWGTPPAASRAAVQDDWRCVFHKKSVAFADREHDGHRVVRIESSGESEVLCGWVSDATAFRGHRIRISMRTKQNAFPPFAHLWAYTSARSDGSAMRIACAGDSD